jgi:hypothetical protein
MSELNEDMPAASVRALPRVCREVCRNCRGVPSKKRSISAHFRHTCRVWGLVLYEHMFGTAEGPSIRRLSAAVRRGGASCARFASARRATSSASRRSCAKSKTMMIGGRRAARRARSGSHRSAAATTALPRASRARALRCAACPHSMRRSAPGRPRSIRSQPPRSSRRPRPMPSWRMSRSASRPAPSRWPQREAQPHHPDRARQRGRAATTGGRWAAQSADGRAARLRRAPPRGQAKRARCRALAREPLRVLRAAARAAQALNTLPVPRLHRRPRTRSAPPHRGRARRKNGARQPDPALPSASQAAARPRHPYERRRRAADLRRPRRSCDHRQPATRTTALTGGGGPRAERTPSRRLLPLTSPRQASSARTARDARRPRSRSP